MYARNLAEKASNFSETSQSCPTVTLGDYCTEREILSCVYFIQADIAGAEWLMLKGATEALRQSRPVLFLEIQSSSTKLFGYEPVDLFAWLADFGYVAHFVANTGSLVLLDEHHGLLPDHNFIFLPSGVA